jgi:hypothetical protein
MAWWLLVERPGAQQLARCATRVGTRLPQRQGRSAELWRNRDEKTWPVADVSRLDIFTGHAGDAAEVSLKVPPIAPLNAPVIGEVAALQQLNRWAACRCPSTRRAGNRHGNDQLVVRLQVWWSAVPPFRKPWWHAAARRREASRVCGTACASKALLFCAAVRESQSAVVLADTAAPLNLG